MIVGQDGESKKGRARRGEGEAAGGPPVEARVCQSNKTSTIFISKHENSDRDKFGKRERTRVLLQGRLGYDLRMT